MSFLVLLRHLALFQALFNATDVKGNIPVWKDFLLVEVPNYTIRNN